MEEVNGSPAWAQSPNHELPLGIDDAENDESKGSVRVVSGSGFRYVVPFPWRLHQMLEDIDKAGDAGIISWLPDGKHFQVHNPQLFVQKIIPKFFKQKSYKSFQRQLHLYGFQRVLEGPNRGAYFHESFSQEDRKLSLDITRIKAPKRRRPPQPPKAAMKPTMQVNQETPSAATNVLSVLDRFQPFNNETSPLPSNETGTVREAKSPPQTQRINFDPVLAFRQNCSCPHTHNQIHGVHQCSSPSVFAAPATTPVQEDSSVIEESSVAETCEWLISAGVPFSAFDPVAIQTTPCASDLTGCADEITSLFAPSKTHSSLTSDSFMGMETFGINEEDASLQIPASMLGELNAAIWGL